MERNADLLEIHFAGARLNAEPSRARPQHEYGDPANHVKFEGERRCDGCVYSRPGKAGKFCGKGKPYGSRCNDFKGRKGK